MPGHVYLVTTVIEGRAPVFQNLWCARALIRALRYQESKGHARTLAFVVMPDHLHWLLRLGERLPLSQVVAVTKRWSAEQVNCELARTDSSSLLALGARQKAIFGMEESGALQVPIKRLDTCLSTPLPRPALLQIDVQGFELEVLKGATGLLARDRCGLRRGVVYRALRGPSAA